MKATRDENASPNVTKHGISDAIMTLVNYHFDGHSVLGYRSRISAAMMARRVRSVADGLGFELT